MKNVIRYCYNNKKNKGEKNMKLLKLLNHEQTETQINELKNNWNVTEIVTLSNENIKRFG